MNTTRLSIFTLFLLGAVRLSAADFVGVVVDQANAPIPGAQVAAINSQGIITQQLTGDDGRFKIYLSPLYESVRFRVAATGFETVTVPAPAGKIQLRVAPV